ncbi:MAG: dimethyl sulfoxide reductase anchor subunit family protein [Geminicoccaceae bacterium]
MHPAPSLIVFTTLSGVGFGLIFWLGIGLGAPLAPFAWFICPAAFALAGFGVAASTFHLGHPERAWRALSQWRSSWLSREGVLAAATLGLFALYALVWLMAGHRSPFLGWLSAAAAAATVHATAMIYAQLKTVPRWNSWLTPLAFLSFGAAGGALAIAVGEALTIGSSNPSNLLALVLIALAWAAKLWWWHHAAEIRLDHAGASPETATGLSRLGEVRQFEPPHTSPNYLLREMVFQVGRRRAEQLRILALLIGCGVPLFVVLLALVASGDMIWLVTAFLAYLGGLAIERWLFFAEAEHVVATYYGHR